MSHPLVPEISVANYTVTVDGEVLDIQSTSAEYFGAVLRMGKVAILQGIEAYYQRQLVTHNGTGFVIPPALGALQLGVDSFGNKNYVFTQKGLTNTDYVHSARSDIRRAIHPYWDAAVESGFLPEVRHIADLGRASLQLTIRARTGDTSFSPDYDPTYFTDIYPCFASLRSDQATAGEVDVCFAHSSGGVVEHTVPLAALDTEVSVETLISRLSNVILGNYGLHPGTALAVRCKFVGSNPKTGEVATEVPAMPRENGKAFMYLPPLN